MEGHSRYPETSSLKPFTLHICILSPHFKTHVHFSQAMRKDYNAKWDLANLLKYHQHTILPFYHKQNSYTSTVKSTKILDVYKKKKRLFQIHAIMQKGINLIIKISSPSQIFFLLETVLPGLHRHRGRDSPWTPETRGTHVSLKCKARVHPVQYK